MAVICGILISQSHEAHISTHNTIDKEFARFRRQITVLLAVQKIALGSLCQLHLL